MSLKKRITDLENVHRTTEQGPPRGIFIRARDCSGEGNHPPLDGWRFETPGSDKVDIWREPGETDEDLQARAIATEWDMCGVRRRPLSVPIFTSITRDPQ